MKDVFFWFFFCTIFFYTKVSHISGFTFQFLTFDKPGEDFFFLLFLCVSILLGMVFKFITGLTYSFSEAVALKWPLPAKLVIWDSVDSHVPPPDQCLSTHVPGYHLAIAANCLQQESISML